MVQKGSGMVTVYLLVLNVGEWGKDPIHYESSSHSLLIKHQ